MRPGIQKPHSGAADEFSVSDPESLVFETVFGLRDVASPAVTPSAVSGRLPASSLCLIWRVRCSRLPAAALGGFKRLSRWTVSSLRPFPTLEYSRLPEAALKTRKSFSKLLHVIVLINSHRVDWFLSFSQEPNTCASCSVRFCNLQVALGLVQVTGFVHDARVHTSQCFCVLATDANRDAHNKKRLMLVSCSSRSRSLFLATPGITIHLRNIGQGDGPTLFVEGRAGRMQPTNLGSAAS